VNTKQGGPPGWERRMPGPGPLWRAVPAARPDAGRPGGGPGGV